MNKKKIINDPVYGFVSIPYEIVFDIIEHPYFQRLRHIQQLGLSSYVYPGALHTRFHHALGATHLMTEAISVLRAKNVEITEEEAKAVTLAILLHDVGHGPFSHALEHSLVDDVSHEELSVMFMERLNKEFDGALDLCLQIFQGNYHKPFLHDLVSSQLDMDRLDYLNRDSFFTGVHEGVIGSDRLIKMLDVRDGRLVMEYKGIYSIEKFLIARRLMYWQVYLHKTVLCAEMMLVKVLQRAKELTQTGADTELFATPAFRYFLENSWSIEDFRELPNVLDQFALMGDMDIFTSIKVWQHHDDPILSSLSKSIYYRKLFKIEMGRVPVSLTRLHELQQKAMKFYGIDSKAVNYLVFADSTSNSVYSYDGTQINIAFKDGSVREITAASDYHNLSQLSTPVVKYYLCYPREIMNL